jgi:inner membrane protein
MPSPIAHVGAGFFIHRLLPTHFDPNSRKAIFARPPLPAIVLFSLLPDVDAIAGLALGDMQGMHNHWTHSLFAGLLAAIVVAAIVGHCSWQEFRRWFTLSLLCYEVHVIMDFFTCGRGIQLWWPFSQDRVASPWLLFYGFHWSDGWFSERHLWTLLNEVGVIVIVSLLLWLSANRPRKTKGD